MIDSTSIIGPAPLSPFVVAERTDWIEPDASEFRFQETRCPFIANAFETQQLSDLNGRVRSMDTFIPREQGDLLFSLVRHLKPLRTIEIGLANGISALHIARAIRENGCGHHWAIDPYQTTDWHGVALASLRQTGLDSLVSLDERPSHWAVPDLEEAGGRVQFAFVDGSHLLDYVMADFMMIDRILDVGGLIAFDDSDWPAVLHVIRFAVTNCEYEVFPTGVVIEPSPFRPRLLTKLARRLVRGSARLQRIARRSFSIPDAERGIEGRCVVLRKTANDSRHALQGQPEDF
ncbi:class I SAM-dependent methyltransferase [Neorhodopirellula lusitana]|uniref:class I SAM-dependent methyltransferase n=1 Tax=Neorhodopirellula lusitana TaxID=445327 RepID=UPI00384DF640